MVADASMLNKLSPFATIIFSMILLREVPKKYQVFCLMLAMSGALFVIKPGFSGNPLGMAAGLIGGVGAGLAYTMVRKLGSNGVQKAVIVLLALLYLGVKNIHLGPTLPAFLSPNVANVLVKNFGIAGIGTVEDDIKLFFGEKAAAVQ